MISSREGIPAEGKCGRGFPHERILFLAVSSLAWLTNNKSVFPVLANYLSSKGIVSHFQKVEPGGRAGVQFSIVELIIEAGSDLLCARSYDALAIGPGAGGLYAPEGVSNLPSLVP